MKNIAYLLTILLILLTSGDTARANEAETFWNSLQKLCGKAFSGEVKNAPEGDSFRGKRLVMHVRSCDDDQIKIPFFVGEDRSRTWILTRVKDRIRLKHDHRHKDGTPDEITMYGGTSSNVGSAGRQVFPADEETAKLIPAAASNVWWIDLDDKSFTYNLRRVGTDRFYSIGFDLTRTISPPPPPWGWKDAKKKVAGPTGDLSELSEIIESNKYERLTSVLVAQNGKVLYEKYHGGFDEKSLQDTRSAGKTVTGTLIGIAIDKGFIKSEKEPIIGYFGDKTPLKNPDPRKARITVEDLLTMSSVLECNDFNPASRGNEERMYIIEDYSKFFLDLPIRGKPPWESPLKDLKGGRRFRYCTAGTFLLGDLLERATKMQVEDFARKYLFEPLGISGETWQLTPKGVAATGGGLRLKSRDFLKIAELYRNGGKFEGTQVISSAWTQKSTKAHTNTGGDTDYGYLWWLSRYGEEDKRYAAYTMQGNGGNKIAVFPELDLVVVLTNRMYGRRLGHQQTDEILNRYIVPAFAK